MLRIDSSDILENGPFAERIERMGSVLWVLYNSREFAKRGPHRLLTS